MGWIGSIITIIIIMLVLMTAVTEPKMTFEYGKAMIKSAKKLGSTTKTAFSNYLTKQQTTPGNHTNLKTNEYE